MSDYCFDAAHGDVVEPKSVCPWCLRERIAELEEVAEAAEVVLWQTMASPPDHARLQEALKAAGYLGDTE